MFGLTLGDDMRSTVSALDGYAALRPRGQFAVNPADRRDSERTPPSP